MPELCNRYLQAVDEARPGLVTGLYVVGSAALGAWQMGASDVDTVILTARALDDDDIPALEAVHATLSGRPFFDGVYVDPATAKVWPADKRPVPFVVGGALRTGVPCGELTPVLWHMLREYGIRVRGPAVIDLGLPYGESALHRFNLDNLRDYWQASVANLPDELAFVPRGTVLDAETVTWFVLGPARLHYTLEHGSIISKADAGEYLARTFPKYADLARRAVRWRAGELETFTAGDLLDAAESVNTVADDAWRRHGPELPN